jgi:hypothetical protein
MLDVHKATIIYGFSFLLKGSAPAHYIYLPFKNLTRKYDDASLSSCSLLDGMSGLCLC